MSFVLTPKEISAWYAGQVVNGLLPLGEATELAKSVGAVTANEIPDWRNILYGAEVWSQLNREDNIFKYLPKTKWNRSGWRVLTAYATSSASDIELTSETDAIPEPVKPKVETLKVTPAPLSLSFEMSLLYEAFVNAGVDDMALSFDQLRKIYALEYAKRVNQILGRRVIGNTSDDTVATDTGIVPIDRIVSGHAESVLNGGTAGKEVGAAVDVYGIDRHSAPSWADSIVVMETNGTTVENQPLTLDLLSDTILNKVPSRGGQTSLIMTRPDTYAKVVQLFMNIARYYLDPHARATLFTYASVDAGTDGVKPSTRIDGGMTVTSIFGVPMAMSVDIPGDGDGTVGRIYGFDLNDPEGYGAPRLSFSVAMPTTYFEIRNPAVVGKPVIRGVYLMFGNTMARRFNTHFKIRNISA